jgi:hypothetical protein
MPSASEQHTRKKLSIEHVDPGAPHVVAAAAMEVVVVVEVLVVVVVVSVVVVVVSWIVATLTIYQHESSGGISKESKYSR